MADLDPDLVLTDTQNWASRSHRELWDAVHNNNDPGQTGEIGAEWGQFGTELTESARVINERVAATESGWTGESADSARAAIKLLADWVTRTAATAVEVGKRVEDQSHIMENARASMPEPVEFTWDEATGTFTRSGLDGFAGTVVDVQAANDQARAAHEQAVAVMTTMERESRSVDERTPLFTAPFNPVTGRDEQPPQMLMATSGAPTLTDAQHVSAPPGVPAGTTVTSGVQVAGTAPTPAYTPPSAPSGGGGGGDSHVAPYRPEGTTAAAAAAKVPVANKYQPPSYQPPTPGHQPPGYVPGYQPPGGKQNPPPYKPAPPNTVIPKAPGGFGPNGAKIPPYVPAGSPGTPPVPGAPGAPGTPPRFGGGGAGGFGGGGAGGFGGGGAGGFGGGGAGGFGPTGGQLAAGGASGVAGPGGGGPRGPMPGYGPAMPGAGAPGAPMGGAPMGGGHGGQGQEDKEHRSAAYIRGEDIFEVPGENLPPSVIGGAKKKRNDQ
ncbi:PPE domain-containing protein [Saccharothrix obliqua]|uniref:PPE domain-containing protein n=1 Tax=Saccharothrix obliqua TaxID=2861747 RepID=UPI001C6075D4|nr:PPE domain-containing protein [Saccharothrix obliqua]MBW4716355.1 PPE domain-containing protein [Saccharothrix obliqua]